MGKKDNGYEVLYEEEYKFQFPIWVRKEFEIKEKKRLTKILFQFPIWVRKFSRKKQIERLLPYQLFQFPIWVRKNNSTQILLRSR